MKLPLLEILLVVAASVACARSTGPPPLPIAPSLGELTAELLLDEVP